MAIVLAENEIYNQKTSTRSLKTCYIGPMNRGDSTTMPVGMPATGAGTPRLLFAPPGMSPVRCKIPLFW